MKLNDRVVAFAIEDAYVPIEQAEKMQDVWRERVGDSPRLIIFPGTQIKTMEGGAMFEFSGEIKPEHVDAFRAWWEKEVAGG